ncbi:MAG: putative glutamine amidotransferase [Alphaproteobacteria bacterium]|jgi:putative glutamine amidotransferase
MNRIDRITTPRPLIGVSGELKDFNGFDIQSAGHKYVYSVVEGFGGMPIILPALGDVEANAAEAMAELVDRLDGIILTGGRANIEPHHYDGDPFRPETYRDPVRDATTLPMVRAAVDRGVPLFGICRGIQEINVAFGGSLHPYLWEVEGKSDHRMPQTDVLEDRFAPRHPVHLTPGGFFDKIASAAGIGGDDVIVNSLHGQAVDRLAEGLVVEALSEDGVIEGVSMPDAADFVVGVQWHAEFRVLNHPFNRALYAEFGAAATRRAAGRVHREGVA